jgi:hypothetical protein
VAIGGLASGARAQAVTYLRFEEGTAGNTVTATGAATPGAVVDSAGGDDNFATFAAANAPTYTATVPFPTVPLTGTANTLALDFPGGRDVFSPDIATTTAIRARPPGGGRWSTFRPAGPISPLRPPTQRALTPPR